MWRYRTLAYLLALVLNFICLLVTSQPGQAIKNVSFSPSKASHQTVKNVSSLPSKPSVSGIDNGVLGWPFSQSEASWMITQGYNASASPDHNCNSTQCYERYGFDFVPISGSAAGKTVFSPATGSVIGGSWPAYNGEGECFVVSLGNSMYVIVCHVVFINNTRPTSVHKGDPVGTVFNAGGNSHIHMNIFSSSTPSSLTQRTAVSFSDPWMISGCDYAPDPREVANDHFLYSANGHYSGVQVPDAAHCGTQAGTPTLTIHWGSHSTPFWSSFNLSRSVLIEVRSGDSSPDIFSQNVTTDATGTATLTLTGVIPNTYNVYIKPRGFLRSRMPSVPLTTGTTTLTYAMTSTGIDCNTHQSTGAQIWFGDVDNNNVINSDDYQAIFNYFNKPLPSNYSDLDGDGTITGVDYNSWLRSMCFFGGGKGEVVGEGGRENSPIGVSATHNSVTAKYRGKSSTTGAGTMSLSPALGSYRVNQTFAVNIQANSSGLLLDGADIVVLYDSSVLTVTQLDKGSIFPSTPVLANDATKGEINISSLANSQSQPVAVSGTLATIHFQVIGSGQTTVTLDFNQNSNAHSSMAQDSTSNQVLGSVFNASYTAGILHVPQDYSTITQALSAANPKETVLVAPGTYHEQPSVPDNVILQGQDPTTTIIDGDGITNQPIVNLGNGSTITGFTIQHSGTNFYDAAIWAGQGPATVTNNHIMNSSMGIVRYCYSPPCSDTSTISSNLIIHNTYTGILIHGAQANVQNNTVVDNQLQGITFEATGAQGSSINNILTNNQTGLTATASTSLIHNLLWQNNPNYDPTTTPGANDLVADPLFINPSTSDYRLHAVSAGIDAAGVRGIYDFIPVGSAPINLAITKTSQGVTLSWSGTGASGYYVATAQNSNFFSQPIDAGNATSHTFSTGSLSGAVQFAVTSYDTQREESVPSFIEASISSLTPQTSLSHKSGIVGSANTITGTNFGANETVNVYWKAQGGLLLGTTATNSSGKATLNFTIPASVAGSYKVYMVGQTSGAVAFSTFTLTPSLHINPTSGARGSNAIVTGSGYGANELVKVKWNCTSSTCSSTLVLGTVTTDNNGNFTLKVKIPTSTTIASHTIGAKGSTSNKFARTIYNVTS